MTNGLLNDLNTALVGEELRRGTRSVYVDYVDYDEIAHHAGMFRPESLAALDGLDRTLSSLETLAALAPRRYRIVVLSDHGQSQGRSFADRYGQTLGDLCSELISHRVESVDSSVEGWGRIGSIAGDVGSGGMAGQVVARVDERVSRETAETEAGTGSGPIVLGSGNLGLVYARGRHRLSLEELTARWPLLVDSLARHPGVGFLAGIDDAGVPWAIGESGRHNLATGDVSGTDPLASFGIHAPRVLRRAVLMPEAPDLYVNSVLDAETSDVAAFEDLVGAHGGLGGWQDRAVLMVPTDFVGLLPDHLEGADEVHRVLVTILEACGQRRPSAATDR